MTLAADCFGHRCSEDVLSIPICGYISKKKLSFLDQNHIFHKLLFFYGDLYLFALIHKDCALKEEVEYISIVLDNFSKFFVYI